mgnify:FL=1
MARLQNSFIIDRHNLVESAPYILKPMQDKYYGMQNLAEEEALKRHEEEKKEGGK